VLCRGTPDIGPLNDWGTSSSRGVRDGEEKSSRMFESSLEMEGGWRSHTWCVRKARKLPSNDEKLLRKIQEKNETSPPSARHILWLSLKGGHSLVASAEETRGRSEEEMGSNPSPCRLPRQTWEEPEDPNSKDVEDNPNAHHPGYGTQMDTKRISIETNRFFEEK
jgi:hypothetical protein